jgi:hypothetical protein
MVFIEFVSLLSNTDNVFFVGSSKEAIFKDTKNGTHFGGYDLKYKEIRSEEYVRKIKKEFIDVGIESIQLGKCESFFL